MASLEDVRAQLDALADTGVCAPGTVPSCKQLQAVGASTPSVMRCRYVHVLLCQGLGCRC
jgi:hypothetical protein